MSVVLCYYLYLFISDLQPNSTVQLTAMVALFLPDGAGPMQAAYTCVVVFQG